MMPHCLQNSTVSLTDYREHTHICQPHCLHNSTVSLTDYRKHTHTHLPASLSTELNCQPHGLQETHTSASLTVYRTQLSVSRTTGNTHICQPHCLQNSIVSLFQERIQSDQSIINQLAHRAGVSDTRITIINVYGRDTERSIITWSDGEDKMVVE